MYGSKSNGYKFKLQIITLQNMERFGGGGIYMQSNESLLLYNGSILLIGWVFEGEGDFRTGVWYKSILGVVEKTTEEKKLSLIK